ncbi:hypothetical protein C5167_029840 [Papaver somniferum]|nr:hypothetical protein C5167_029840 [Papaver somniferum]
MGREESRRTEGTASLEEKKKRQTVKMKKLRRSVVPCKLSLGCVNMVAIRTPINVRTICRERKSSGVLRMFVKFRRMSIHTSTKNELANLGPSWWCTAKLVGPLGVKSVNAGVCGGVWMIVENDSSKSESFGGFIPVIAKSASAVTPISD